MDIWETVCILLFLSYFFVVLTLSLSLNVCDNCDSAEELILQDNGLTGAIPDQVCALTPNPLSLLWADCDVCTTAGCCNNCF